MTLPTSTYWTASEGYEPDNPLGAMPLLPTGIDAQGEGFRRNAEAMGAALAELRGRLREVQAGGGAEAVKRHRSRNKLLPRERIDLLLDPATPFMELNALAAWGMYDGDAPSAGIVTGIGRVCGREVVVVANDATVKGGTYYPITVKKHLRAQEIAL